MRKGDLIRRVVFPISGSNPQLKSYVNELKVAWQNPCIIVRGPYEATFVETIIGTKQKMTKLRLAIDVVYEGELRTRLFPSDFKKV